MNYLFFLATNSDSTKPKMFYFHSLIQKQKEILEQMLLKKCYESDETNDCMQNIIIIKYSHLLKTITTDKKINSYSKNC